MVSSMLQGEGESSHEMSVKQVFLQKKPPKNNKKKSGTIATGTVT